MVGYSFRRRLVKLLDVRCAWATIRLLDFELDVFALFGRLVAIHEQGTIVEEVVLVVFTVNEAVTLLLVEHFNCSLHEKPNLPSRKTDREILYHRHFCNA